MLNQDTFSEDERQAKNSSDEHVACVKSIRNLPTEEEEAEAANSRRNRLIEMNFQEKCLAHLLFDTATLSRFHEVVVPEFFDQEWHSWLFSLAQAHFHQYKEAPGKIIIHHLALESLNTHKRSQRYVTDYTELYPKFESYDLSNTDFVADKIQSWARQTAMTNAAEQAADLIEAGRLDEAFAVQAEAAAIGQTQNENDFDSGCRFLSLDDCERVPVSPYLIKGLIAEKQICAIIGQPSAGKSVLAPYIAHAVAAGRSIFGKRVKAVPVLYLAAEDPDGMLGRMRGLKRRHGDTDNLRVVADISRLNDPQSRHVEKIINRVKADGVKLVIIDTVNAAFDISENDSGKDGMGAVISLAFKIRDAGAAVLFIHHTTKDGNAKTGRGHGSFHGILDLNIIAKREDGSKTVKCSLNKNRNGTDDFQFSFAIDSVDVGEDEDGDTITAPVAHELDKADAGPDIKLSRVQQVMLDTLRDGVGSLRMMPYEEWLEAGSMPSLVSNAESSKFRRHKAKVAADDLIKMKRVSNTPGGCIIVDG